MSIVKIPEHQLDLTNTTARIDTAQNALAELGDQVSNIESKIPNDASETNPLATKTDLKNYLPLTGGTLSGVLKVKGNKVLDTSDKSVANGVASLDANAKVPSGQIPVATASTLGGVKVDGTTVTATADGTLSAVIPDVDLSGYLQKAGGTMSGALIANKGLDASGHTNLRQVFTKWGSSERDVAFFDIASVTIGNTAIPLKLQGSTITANGSIVQTVANKGVANGIASLDDTAKVPVAQLPDLSETYIPVSKKDAPNGVAGLDANSKLSANQIPVDGTTITLDEDGNLKTVAGSAGESGAGRPIGEVFFSQSELATDNPGALPLFTGETIASVNTIYPDFYNWVLAHTELQCTSAEYESALSTYGECPKYVVIASTPTRYKWENPTTGVLYTVSRNPAVGDLAYDVTGNSSWPITEASSTEIVVPTFVDSKPLSYVEEVAGTSASLRLPKLSNYIKAANTSEGITQKEAGLPNITGVLYSVRGSDGVSSSEGALYNTAGDSNGSNSSGSASCKNIRFDASRSSPVYGRSDTVTPAHTTLYPWVVAYTAAIPASTAQAAEFQQGLSGKADTSLANLSTTGKSLVSGLGMPSNRYIDLTFGASGAEYIAPANGYYCIFGTQTSTSGWLRMWCVQNALSIWIQPPNVSNFNISCFLPILKGKTLILDYENFTVSSIGYFRFIYAEGDK